MTNFAGTLGVDTAWQSALAAFGYLNPVLAALIHVTSELVFILNSARLLSRSKSESHLAQPAPEKILVGTEAVVEVEGRVSRQGN